MLVTAVEVTGQAFCKQEVSLFFAALLICASVTDLCVGPTLLQELLIALDSVLTCTHACLVMQHLVATICRLEHESGLYCCGTHTVLHPCNPRRLCNTGLGTAAPYAVHGTYALVLVV